MGTNKFCDCCKRTLPTTKVSYDMCDECKKRIKNYKDGKSLFSNIVGNVKDKLDEDFR